MLSWLKDQVEWLKSFVSESYVNGKAGKASSKRVIELAVVTGFLSAFLKIVIYMTIVSLGKEVTNVPDMPWGWATVIFGILGLKVYENTQNAKNIAAGGPPNGDAESPKQKPGA